MKVTPLAGQVYFNAT